MATKPVAAFWKAQSVTYFQATSKLLRSYLEQQVLLAVEAAEQFEQVASFGVILRNGEEDVLELFYLSRVLRVAGHYLERARS